MLYLVYNLLLAAAALVLVPYYVVRNRLKGQPWSCLPQRFGSLPASFDSTGSDSIWLHAVSVGEVLSCSELLKALRQRFPRSPIFVSTATVTGQHLAQEKLAPLADGIFYAPLDFPFAVRRTLATLKPRLVIVAETEIWPNLFRQTKQFGASLLLVNGRLSDRSLPRYRWLRFFFARVLAHAAGKANLGRADQGGAAPGLPFPSDAASGRLSVRQFSHGFLGGCGVRSCKRQGGF